MYAGRIAELGTVYDVFSKALHPYSQGLMKSVPNIRLEEGSTLFKMAGEPPNLLQPPTGCRFHPRCPQAMEICSRKVPSFKTSTGDHLVACWLYEEHSKEIEEQPGAIS